MPTPSSTHLVLIPSYNTGIKLEQTVRDALEVWSPVWVVLDGSTDDSLAVLNRLRELFPKDLRVIPLSENQGKGNAVWVGLKKAIAEGYTHILTMDADGQHDPMSIQPFMAASASRPEALVLGLPKFDDSAPLERLMGRRIANFFANFETFGAGIGDCLFGFRVYPARFLLEVLNSTRWARRFDFDPEVAIRLAWQGIPIINLPAQCRYFRKSEGGVSHFNYIRDNLLLIWMYHRLFAEMLIRLPWLIRHRLTVKCATTS